MVAVLCEARWSQLSGLPLSRSDAMNNLLIAMDLHYTRIHSDGHTIQGELVFRIHSSCLSNSTAVAYRDLYFCRPYWNYFYLRSEEATDSRISRSVS